MSIVTLLLYGTLATYIECKYGSILDMPAHTTITVYFVSVAITFLFAFYEINTIGDPTPRFVHIPSQVAEFAIIAVFYYFLYELRLVKLKLECGNLEQFMHKLNRTR